MIMKNKSKWIGLVWVLCGLRLMAQDTVDEGVRQLIRESLPRVTEAVRAANAGSDRPVTLMPPGVLVTKGAKVSAVEAYMESLLKTAWLSRWNKVFGRMRWLPLKFRNVKEICG
jgi:hypothetical protein